MRNPFGMVPSHFSRMRRGLALCAAASLAIAQPAFALRQTASEETAVKGALLRQWSAATQTSPDFNRDGGLEEVDLEKDYRRSPLSTLASQVTIYEPKKQSAADPWIIKVFQHRWIRDKHVQEYVRLTEAIRENLKAEGLAPSMDLTPFQLVRLKSGGLAVRTPLIAGEPLDEAIDLLNPDFFIQDTAEGRKASRLQKRAFDFLKKVDTWTGGLSDRHGKLTGGETGGTLSNFIVREEPTLVQYDQTSIICIDPIDIRKLIERMAHDSILSKVPVSSLNENLALIVRVGKDFGWLAVLEQRLISKYGGIPDDSNQILHELGMLLIEKDWLKLEFRGKITRLVNMLGPGRWPEFLRKRLRGRLIIKTYENSPSSPWAERIQREIVLQGTELSDALRRLNLRSLSQPTDLLRLLEYVSQTKSSKEPGSQAPGREENRARRLERAVEHAMTAITQRLERRLQEEPLLVDPRLLAVGPQGLNDYGPEISQFLNRLESKTPSLNLFVILIGREASSYERQSSFLIGRPDAQAAAAILRRWRSGRLEYYATAQEAEQLAMALKEWNTALLLTSRPLMTLPLALKQILSHLAGLSPTLSQAEVEAFYGVNLNKLARHLKELSAIGV